MDTLKENISINGQILSNFSFNIKPDFTNLNLSSIQGIFGLGINEKKNNPLVNFLYLNEIIHSKEIYFSFFPIPKMKFAVDISKNEKKKFFYCDLTDRDDLNKKYKESFICDYSHLILDNNKNFNESILINGRAIFDSTNNFIIIPIDYIEIFYEIWPLNKSDCKEFDNENNETIFYCNFELLKNGINEIKNLTFVFDGIGYKIKNEDLFEKINNNFFVSKIKFRKEKNNIWTIGIPFLKNFDIMFDYENKKIGIKNNENYNKNINNNNNENKENKNIFNYTEDYLKWKKENENFLNININEKKIMIAGMIIGSLILVTLMIWIIRKCIKNNIEDEEDNNNNNNGKNNNNNNKNNNKKKGNHVELIEEIP